MFYRGWLLPCRFTLLHALKLLQLASSGQLGADRLQAHGVGQHILAQGPLLFLLILHQKLLELPQSSTSVDHHPITLKLQDPPILADQVLRILDVDNRDGYVVLLDDFEDLRLLFVPASRFELDWSVFEEFITFLIEKWSLKAITGTEDEGVPCALGAGVPCCSLGGSSRRFIPLPILFSDDLSRMAHVAAVSRSVDFRLSVVSF